MKSWIAIGVATLLVGIVACDQGSTAGESAARDRSSLETGPRDAPSTGGSKLPVKALIDDVSQEIQGLKSRIEKDERLHAKYADQLNSMEAKLTEARAKLDAKLQKWGIVDDKLRAQLQESVSRIQVQILAIAKDVSA